jgi:hypothetical protein
MKTSEIIIWVLIFLAVVTPYVFWHNKNPKLYVYRNIVIITFVLIFWDLIPRELKKYALHVYVMIILYLIYFLIQGSTGNREGFIEGAKVAKEVADTDDEWGDQPDLRAEAEEEMARQAAGEYEEDEGEYEEDEGEYEEDEGEYEEGEDEEDWDLGDIGPDITGQVKEMTSLAKELNFDEYTQDAAATFTENLAEFKPEQLEAMNTQMDKFMSNQEGMISMISKVAPALTEGMKALQQIEGLKDSLV